MKKLNIKTILLTLIILILSYLSYHFYNLSTKPDVSIQIGVPEGESAIIFGNYINNIDDANFIQFCLINAETIKKPSIANKLPDAVILINDNDLSTTYVRANVWYSNENNEQKLIYQLGDPEYDNVVYKETTDTLNKFISIKNTYEILK